MNMTSTPVEDNFVLQAVLVVVIVLAMVYTGQTVGTYFQEFDLPYGAGIGFAVGMTVIFVLAAIVYKGLVAFLEG